MRAAAVFSAAVIAVGVYLAVAATLAISTSWFALGIIAIAVFSAMGAMATEGSSAPSPSR
jgi:hypothetical protein